EEVAGPEAGDRLAVPDDPYAATGHEEESGADLALSSDDVILGELDLDDASGDGGDPVRVDAREQRRAGEQLRPIVLGDRRTRLHPRGDAALRGGRASR